MANSDPSAAWRTLMDGNERFVRAKPEHPSQSIHRRTELVNGQHPIAAVFGCGDSRVAAEIIFDQGLGDMFIVRTAGHVLDSAVLGSIEYAVEVLEVPLILVLGHDNCGAVQATLDALDNGLMPPGFIRDVVERITPSILIGRNEGLSTVDEFAIQHVVETATLLTKRSHAVSDRIARGRCTIAAVSYELSDGRVKLQRGFGQVDFGDRLADANC